MPKYLYMDRKTAIIKNQLWKRRYWYRKCSIMRYRQRYKYHDVMVKYIFSE